MTNKVSRREAITGIIGAGAGALTMSDGVFAGEAQENLPPAFAGKHAAKDLPFNPAKLTGISEKLITSHHDNNHVGSVKALNVIEQRLEAMM